MNAEIFRLQMFFGVALSYQIKLLITGAKFWLGRIIRSDWCVSIGKKPNILEKLEGFAKLFILFNRPHAQCS